MAEFHFIQNEKLRETIQTWIIIVGSISLIYLVFMLLR